MQVTEFRILDGEAGGWREQGARILSPDKHGYEFIPDKGTLNSRIMGGAWEYVDEGYKEGIIQEMTYTGPAGQQRSFTGFIFDFGTEKQAEAIFEKKTCMWDVKPLAETAPDTAVAAELLGGCMLFAHTGRFYFELTLVGYESFKDAMTAGEEIFHNYVQTQLKILDRITG